MSTSILRLVWIYPDLLSTYGDRGNLLILGHRAESRRIVTESISVRSDQAIPREADVYLVGGGEDGPQSAASQKIITDGALVEAADRGKVIFGVCAGYQLLGNSFMTGGRTYDGLGLLDMHSTRGETRAVGEVSGTTTPALDLPPITGFENHGGRTQLGPQTQPLAQVTHGIGNDEATEGAWNGKVLGTYMHGPALARNPDLADLLLSWATGKDRSELPALDDQWFHALRDERLTHVGAGAV